MTSEQKRLVKIFNVLSILFFVVAIVVMTAVVGGVNRRVFWNSVHEVGEAGSIPFRSFQRPEVYIPMVNSYGLPTVCATFKAPAGTDFPAVYIPGTSGGEKDEVCAYRKRRESNIKLARSQCEDKFKKLAGVTSTSSEPAKQGKEELWERLRRKGFSVVAPEEFPFLDPSDPNTAENVRSLFGTVSYYCGIEMAAGSWGPEASGVALNVVAACGDSNARNTTADVDVTAGARPGEGDKDSGIALRHPEHAGAGVGAGLGTGTRAGAGAGAGAENANESICSGEATVMAMKFGRPTIQVTTKGALMNTRRKDSQSATRKNQVMPLSQQLQEPAATVVVGSIFTSNVSNVGKADVVVTDRHDTDARMAAVKLISTSAAEEAGSTAEQSALPFRGDNRRHSLQAWGEKAADDDQVDGGVEESVPAEVEELNGQVL